MFEPASLALGRAAAAFYLQKQLERQFNRVGAKAPPVRVRYRRADNPPNDVLIERRGEQLTVVVEDADKRRIRWGTRNMVCPFAYWLTRCPAEVTQIFVNTSDGEVVSNARFAASVRFPYHVGLPDPHYFQNHGFASEMVAGKSAPEWEARSDDIVWRGGMNGVGWLSWSEEDATNPAALQRMRMVMLLKNVPGTDVRFSELLSQANMFGPIAVSRGYLDSPIAAKTWLSRKFAIDIDGFSNTWSNFLVRMLYGCCVLKVQSQFGFRQWYYDKLVPYEHYVPVAADMSDFAEKIEWVRSNDAEASAIARRGQAFAQTLTFESQTRRAVEIIEEHWDRDVSSYSAN